VLPGYHKRPGRYFLPSSFTPVRITKLLTNSFSIFYLLLNFKLPVLVLIWDLEQKKLESVFPHHPLLHCPLLAQAAFPSKIRSSRNACYIGSICSGCHGHLGRSWCCYGLGGLSHPRIAEGRRCSDYRPPATLPSSWMFILTYIKTRRECQPAADNAQFLDIQTHIHDDPLGLLAGSRHLKDTNQHFRTRQPLWEHGF
jgi:hypothetical protein